MLTRYIFITGGVVSSLGKGLAAASLAALLQARGYSVRLRKLDPYLNVDPGTMSPMQHGEVFVTEDGAETDLDLGHYERFTGVDARKGDNVTTGQIYSTLLVKERKGDYLGGTVQVIPHVTDLIKDFITSNVASTDFVICEIGGTVGDIEAQPFLEAARQLAYQLGNLVVFTHVTLIPYLSAARELKTKPTQHSVKELRSIGISPNIILCRSEKEIPLTERKKIALFCNVNVKSVIPALDLKSIYQAPTYYHEMGLDNEILRAFGIEKPPKPKLEIWEDIVEKINSPQQEVRIAIVGKYVKLKDAYKSIIEAFTHAGIANSTKVKLSWINSRVFNSIDAHEKLKDFHGILIPGGFGSEGTEGKIRAIQYARENKVPFFGICLGMQLAVIEAARNLCGLEAASSTEFGETKDPVIDLMEEWKKGEKVEKRSHKSDLGGTMRLGSYECYLKPGSLLTKIYDSETIRERHRHRYEVNIKYKEKLEKVGLVFSGMSECNNLPETMERSDHPWFVGVQFHPELKSRPFEPHPLFKSFVKAALEHKGVI